MSYTHFQFYKIVTISLIASFCTWIWYITFWSKYHDCQFVGFLDTETVSIYDRSINEYILMYKTEINYCNLFTKSVYHSTPEKIFSYKPKYYLPTIKTYFGNIFENDHNYYKYFFLIFPVPIYPIFTLLCALLIQRIYNIKNEIVGIHNKDSRKKVTKDKIFTNELPKIPIVDSNANILKTDQEINENTNVLSYEPQSTSDERSYVITEEKKNQ